MEIGNRILLRAKVDSKKDEGEKFRFYEIGWKAVPTDGINVQKKFFESFCNAGCKMYGNNGGCPPNAPSFEHMKGVYKTMVLVWVRLSKSEMPQAYFDNPKHKYAYFYPTNFANSVLPPIMKHIYKNMEPLKADRYLGESACKLCNPCRVPKDKICNHPKLRIFSLESTGIDTNKLMEDFVFPMYWYNGNTPIADIPYTVKIVGLLYKSEKVDVDFTKNLVEILNKHPKYLAQTYESLI